jgi:hypothetical protein
VSNSTRRFISRVAPLLPAGSPRKYADPVSYC